MAATDRPGATGQGAYPWPDFFIWECRVASKRPDARSPALLSGQRRARRRRPGICQNPGVPPRQGDHCRGWAYHARARRSLPRLGVITRKPIRPVVRSMWILVAALAARATIAAAQEQVPAKLPPIEVIGTTPLRGAGTPANEVPGNVQSFTGREIGRQLPTDIADFLGGNANSVSTNAPSGNPFQNDVS